MGYCFMTTKKIKSEQSMTRAYQHNYRMEKVSNAIPELKDANVELVKLCDEQGKPTTYQKSYQDRIRQLNLDHGPKIRQDAVKGIEVLMTYSREDAEKINDEKWMQDNVDWLRKTFNACPEKYGDNVISVMYHGDECGNPHIHAFVIPIDDKGHLNAQYYVGGPKKMRDLQTSYGEAMRSHGLERGIEGSTAKHRDIKKFYTNLNQKMNVPPPFVDEPALAYRERILTFVQEERAAALRELLTKETRMRQQLDQTHNRNMNAAKETFQAQKNAHYEDLKELRQKVANKKQELQELYERYNAMAERYSQLTDQAKHLSEMIEKVDTAKTKLDWYDHYHEVTEFAKQEMPEMAENFDREFHSMEQVFEQRDIEH